MLIKSADDKRGQIDALLDILKSKSISNTIRDRVEKELGLLRAGLKGEKEAAYEIDFHFKEWRIQL
jgi:hypothetical protein